MLIDGKSFFDMPIKNDEETYEQIIQMGRNNDYTTDNLLDYDFEFSQNAAIVFLILTTYKNGNPKSFANLLANAVNKSLKCATRKWYVIND